MEDTQMITLEAEDGSTTEVSLEECYKQLELWGIDMRGGNPPHLHHKLIEATGITQVDENSENRWEEYREKLQQALPANIQAIYKAIKKKAFDFLIDHPEEDGAVGLPPKLFLGGFDGGQGFNKFGGSHCASNLVFNRIYLWGANLPGAQFSECMMQTSEFNSSNLAGANFSNSELEGSIFDGATLTKADFRDANVEGGMFDEADLTKATLEDCNLEEVEAQRAKFIGASLESANMKNADFSESNFSEADLSNADMTESKFIKTIFSGANLEDASLGNSDFSEADFTETTLSSLDIVSDSKFVKTNFSEADLQDLILNECDLSGAILKKANLTNTCFDNCKLSDADFAEANIAEEACFEGSDLTGALWIDGTKIDRLEGETWLDEDGEVVVDLSEYTARADWESL